MSVSLSDVLQLDVVDTHHFRNVHNRENFRQTLFGGQVLAQGLKAAALTCEDRLPHSLHAYFLLPGTSAKPVDYHVENVRDGRYFSNRRVSARQDQRELFSMMVSFHQQEGGFSHQEAPGVDVPTPETLLQTHAVEHLNTHVPASTKSPFVLPFEILNIAGARFDLADPQAPKSQFWLRSLEPLHSPLEHLCILAFVSDFGLLASALLPHTTHLFSPSLVPATLDHAMWFHETHFNLNHWTLFNVDSPWAGHARGVGRSLIYDRENVLIASATQEGLIRSL